MGLKQRGQIKAKQKIKRRLRRQKLIKKGLDPAKYFSGKIYVGNIEAS